MEPDKFDGSVTFPLARYEELREKEKQEDNRAELAALLHQRELELMTVLDGLKWVTNALKDVNPSLRIYHNSAHDTDILEELRKIGIEWYFVDIEGRKDFKFRVNILPEKNK